MEEDFLTAPLFKAKTVNRFNYMFQVKVINIGNVNPVGSLIDMIVGSCQPVGKRN